MSAGVSYLVKRASVMTMRIIGWLREAGHYARERAKDAAESHRKKARSKPIVSDLAEFHPAAEAGRQHKVSIISINGRDVAPEELRPQKRAA